MYAKLRSLTYRPVTAEGAKGWDDFACLFLPTRRELRNIGAHVFVIGASVLVIGMLSVGNAYLALGTGRLAHAPGLMPILLVTLVAPIATIWILLSGGIVSNHLTMARKYYGGSISLVALPWRQAWPWLYMLAVLPWAWMYILSSLRLAVTIVLRRPLARTPE